MFQKLFITVSFLFVALHADSVLKYNMGSEINTFYYSNDNHAKMVPQSDKEGSSEIYAINKKIYIVSYHDGILSIVDLNKTKSFMDSMGISFVQEAEEKHIPEFKIHKTSKKERVAGINGEVWYLSDDDNKEKTKVVVTNKKAVVQAVRKMFAMFEKISPDAAYNYYEIEKGYLLIKADEMELLEFSTKKIPKSTYKLPTAASYKAKQKKHVATTQKAVPQTTNKKATNPTPSSSLSDEDIDKAAKLFKSLF